MMLFAYSKNCSMSRTKKTNSLFTPQSFSIPSVILSLYWLRNLRQLLQGICSFVFFQTNLFNYSHCYLHHLEHLELHRQWPHPLFHPTEPSTLFDESNFMAVMETVIECCYDRGDPFPPPSLSLSLSLSLFLLLGELIQWATQMQWKSEGLKLASAVFRNRVSSPNKADLTQN